MCEDTKVSDDLPIIDHVDGVADSIASHTKGNVIGTIGRDRNGYRKGYGENGKAYLDGFL